MGGTVSFVDVGQGDCVIAVDRDTGESLMMDCPSGGDGRALAALEQLEATRLRIVIASHQHLDHLGGIYAVVTSFPTEKVKLNPPTNIPADQNERKKLRAAIRAIHGLPRKGISIEQASAGEAGDLGKVHWRIMSPSFPQLLQAGAMSRPNHASVVLKVSIEGIVAIASSDSDGEAWSEMASRGEDLHADILQIPHHGGLFPTAGSSWSLTTIVQHISAAYHVISVGSRNPYGHPAQATLSLLRSQLPQRKFFCTQLNPICASCKVQPNTSCAGTVTFACKNGQLEVEPSPRVHAANVQRYPTPQCI
jgi:beta-lactamase superfamily II metal-dependent hydrolase